MLSLLLLSTSRRAFTCSGVKSSTQTQGTSSMPSFCAANARQCPITITPLRSITIGCTNPYCRMLSATLLICLLSCFFAFFVYGIISDICLLITFIANHLYLFLPALLCARLDTRVSSDAKYCRKMRMEMNVGAPPTGCRQKMPRPAQNLFDASVAVYI